MTERNKPQIADLLEAAQTEMAYAWNVVKSLLPDANQTWCGYELSGLLIPARKVGGDFFDFFRIGENQMGFIIADATGKGTGPCLQVATCRAYFRALAIHQPHDLCQIAGTLNRLVFDDLRPDKFITACFGWLDRRENEIHYVNAGHGSGFLRLSGSVTEIEPSDPPLGVLRDFSFTDRVCLIKPDDLVAIFTDGWTERQCPCGDEYGEERLVTSLERTSGLSAKEALRAVYQRYELDCQPTPQGDDVTAIFIRRT